MWLIVACVWGCRRGANSLVPVPQPFALAMPPARWSVAAVAVAAAAARTASFGSPNASMSHISPPGPRGADSVQGLADPAYTALTFGNPVIDSFTVPPGEANAPTEPRRATAAAMLWKGVLRHGDAVDGTAGRGAVREQQARHHPPTR